MNSAATFEWAPRPDKVGGSPVAGLVCQDCAEASLQMREAYSQTFTITLLSTYWSGA